MKLEDGVRLHEKVKVDLETYARENQCEIVKPFLLVIARDTTHAKELIGIDPIGRVLRGPLQGKRSSRWIPAGRARKKRRWSNACSRWSTPTSRRRS